MTDNQINNRVADEASIWIDNFIREKKEREKPDLSPPDPTKFRVIECRGKFKPQRKGIFGWRTLGYSDPDLVGLDATFDSKYDAEMALYCYAKGRK